MEGEMFLPVACPKCRRIEDLHAFEDLWFPPQQIEIGYKLMVSCGHCGHEFAAIEIPLCTELMDNATRYVVEWTTIVFQVAHDLNDLEDWQRASLWANLSGRLETVLRVAPLTDPQGRAIEQLLRGAERLAQEYAHKIEVSQK